MLELGSLLLDPLIATSLVLGFLMAWAVGANDVANAMASTVGSKILTVTQAVIIASIFEALGSLLASSQVTQMIQHGVVDLSSIPISPQHFAIGMIASLLAASSWLFIATMRGWPVSTTHTIIGAVTGFALVEYGSERIFWSSLARIGLSWVLTPVIACCTAFMLFGLLRKKIFSARQPEKRTILFIPIYTALTVGMFSGVTLFRGLRLLGFNLTFPIQSTLLLALTSLSAIGSFLTISKQLPVKDLEKKDMFIRLDAIENSFGFLAILTAASMAFAHGANDVANAIGPAVAVYTTMVPLLTGAQVTHIPVWIVAIGSTGIVLGLVTFGYKIMHTVGSNITQLTQSRGFVAQFTTSSLIMLASGMGLPVSTTQTMVGAILGVGLARGFLALNLSVIQNIFLSWLITLPAGGLLSAAFFLALKPLFSLFYA